MFFYLFICARAQQGPHPSEKIIKGWIIWYFSIFEFQWHQRWCLSQVKFNDINTIHESRPKSIHRRRLPIRYDTVSTYVCTFGIVDLRAWRKEE